MKILVKTTHFSLTPALQNYVDEKIGHLENFFKKIQIAKIELEHLSDHKTKEKYRAEGTIDAPQHVFYAEAFSNDMYAAIDLLEAKLGSQMERLKEKKLDVMKKTRRTIKQNLG